VPLHQEWAVWVAVCQACSKKSLAFFCNYSNLKEPLITRGSFFPFVLFLWSSCEKQLLFLISLSFAGSLNASAAAFSAATDASYASVPSAVSGSDPFYPGVPIDLIRSKTTIKIGPDDFWLV